MWGERPAAGVLVSVFAIALLVAAAVLFAAAEWPRIQSRAGSDGRRRRRREKRKRNLRVVGSASDSDDFARAVERDLAALPTIDEKDAKKRR